MLNIGVLVVFLFVLILGAAYLMRLLFPSDDNEVSEPLVKRIGKPTALSPAPLPAENYYVPPVEAPRQFRRKRFSGFFSLMGLLVCGYVVYENRESIANQLPATVTSMAQVSEPGHARATISAAAVEGHASVDGVNWFKIVATSTSGVPFEGWVSEMAIQNQPPKENKMADDMMKKLGLPTNKERIESVKKLKRIGEALNIALEKDKVKN